MTLKDIITTIEAKYPLSLAESWDNVGLMIGDYEANISRILVVLEINADVVKEAIDQQADLIITHHPFLFKKINKINTGDLKGSLSYQLIQHGISVYSMHTNFDIAFDGLNDHFMHLLGIQDTKTLEPTNAEESYRNAHPEKQVGLGRIGVLDKTLTLKELCELLKETLRMEHIRVCGELSSTIRTVAVVTGGASDRFPLAKQAGADVLISGDMKYHEAQDARDLAMNVIDCGHFETENIFPDAITPFLSTLSGIQIIKSKVNLNPFRIV